MWTDSGRSDGRRNREVSLRRLDLDRGDEATVVAGVGHAEGHPGDRGPRDLATLGRCGPHHFEPPLVERQEESGLARRLGVSDLDDAVEPRSIHLRHRLGDVTRVLGWLSTSVRRRQPTRAMRPPACSIRGRPPTLRPGRQPATASTTASDATSRVRSSSASPWAIDGKGHLVGTRGEGHAPVEHGRGRAARRDRSTAEADGSVVVVAPGSAPTGAKNNPKSGPTTGTWASSCLPPAVGRSPPSPGRRRAPSASAAPNRATRLERSA